MKLLITLAALSLLILLVAFQSKRFTPDEDLQWYIYDVADSAAWVVFSLLAYLLSTRIKITGTQADYQAGVKILRSFLGLFTSLSICPLVNALNHESGTVRIGNYIYGGLVVVVYLTMWIVKKYKNAKH